MEIETAAVALLFIMLAVFGKMVLKSGLNPITVFCGIWGAIVMGYSFHAYDLYKASWNSISLIIFGVFSFFVGACIAIAIKGRSSSFSKDTTVVYASLRPNYKLLFILNVVAFTFLIGFGVTTIQMLLSGRNFYYIHRLYNQETGTIGASRTYQNIISWYVWPLMDASIATLAVSVQCDREKNPFKKWAIIFILVNLALFTIITGKRSHLGYIVAYVIAVFYMQGRKLKLRNRTKFALVLAGAFIVWAFNSISTSRGSESILKTLYIYFVGCIPHLSVKIDNLYFYPKGITSIYGIYQPILLIINSFFHSSFLSSIRSSMGELVAVTQSRAIIGPGISFNAFLTPFYYFYLDGGFLGNILLSMLFGLFSMLVYFNHLKNRSFKSLTVYLLVFFTLYMSMVRIQFFQMRFVLSFLYVYLIYKKSKLRIVIGNSGKKRPE